MAYFNKYLIVILILFNLTSVSNSQLQQRNPVLEFCTGTWCQWCPCGHLIAEEILTAFPNAIIIGYHGPINNAADPFSFFQGNSIISSFGFSAYPTGIIDRVSGIQSRSAWNGWMYNRNSVAATVSINVNAAFNPVTRELNGTIDFTALTNLSGQFKYNVILLEDGIIWSQTGNSSCPGDIHYIHKNVVRDMMNGSLGEEIINGSWILNQVITKSINRVIPTPPGPAPDMNWDNCSIVVMVYKVGSPLANNGEIQQAGKYPLTNINVPYMGVTSPNGGENWIGGSNQTLTWESNLVSDVNIEFSTDGGISWELIVESIQNTEIYDWSVPYTVSTNSKIKVTDANNSTLYDESDSSFSIYLMEFNVNEGWNIVSIPLCQNDMTISGLFTNAISEAYGYGAGYFIEDTLKNGFGYWIKFDSTEVIFNGGNQADSNVVPVNIGWNLIGPFHENINLGSIVTIPDNLFVSPFYGYNGGYYSTTEINIGTGYWVKTWSDGLVIMNSSLLVNSKNLLNNPVIDDDWGKIIITDYSGKNCTLYTVDEQVDLRLYELPPAPPTGMFDIRFSSGRIAEDINSSVKAIDMSGITYPLTVRVENMDIRLQDETGKAINVNLKAGEDIVISDATVMKLIVTGELIPTQYALEQNYPNPFNPSTVIEFSLPEDVSNVKLSIYNALGEKVAELVNTALTAGKYQYQWNAQNVATGMYIYELRTDKFVSVKKMVLIR